MDEMKNVIWGVFEEKRETFCIYQIDDCWFLYIVDGVPEDRAGTAAFFEDNINDGYSFSGTFEEVMDKFKDICY